MTDRTITMTSRDLDRLAHLLGHGWAERFVDDDQRSAAIAELIDAVDGLRGHHRRADSKGCTCGWDGDAMLTHLQTVHEHDDDRALLLELLTETGATVEVIDERSYAVTFPDAQTTAAVAWPLDVDRYDWNRPPGDLLRIWAAARDRSDQDVALACDLPLDVYRGILAGSEVITDDIARKLETGIGIYPKNIWLRLERGYRAALVAAARQPSRYPS